MDPVQDAIKQAAEQNAPLFGSSSLTLKSPLLWLAVAATIGVHFVNEHFVAEREKEAANVERLKVGIETYRARRRAGPDAGGGGGAAA